MTRSAGGTTVHHPWFARMWVRIAAAAEEHGAAEHRARLLAEARGRVLELGAGTGANFAHYPPGVDEVLAVEPEPHLRTLAEQAGERAGVPVTVVDGTADALPAADASVDTAVASLVLCSVPDQATALAELRRVLRPGGRLLFWEHVRSGRPGAARVQRLLDRTVWPAVGGGCHCSRQTLDAITDAGFAVERVERFRFPDVRLPAPTAPQVLGVAVRG
ncbi:MULTISPECIES: class I SAM-dependent methyltransferase [unclassified Blastococcus]|uniref:class I SAM-dependent methyltransferase n=1 Tax=unclassified Blastococcus TaxID=2619396 RepID=UPI001F5C04B6|nr:MULTISPECIES: class I SAM-dependent methyltransferase [unclassified Blastococcus]